MAKVKINQLIKVLNGAIGGLVFREMPDGSVVVSAAPYYGGKHRKSSQKQKAHQRRFKQATRYARGAAKTYPIYAELAKGTLKSAYNFALSDWWHAPVIHEVRRMDGRLLVHASDNIMVTKVQVKVLDEEGKVLENGEAIRRTDNWWEYIPTASGKTVAVEAWDLARNVTKASL